MPSRASSPGASRRPCPRRRCAGTTGSSPNGLAVVLPRSQVAELAQIPGVAKVWPNVRYHALRDTGGPEQIGADKLWGPNFETAGNGMKIGIIDDGLEATHPYFNPNGFQYPAGFPKGPDQVHDAEGDRPARVHAGVPDLEVLGRCPSTR